MNRLWICGDIWLNILPFFDHAKLGLNLALLSDRYDALVDTHFNGKKEFTLWRCIKIDKELAGPKATLSVRIDDELVAFPLPDHPLPNKIRFRFLLIEYIDHSVIEFLRSNKQIWDRMGTKLEFFCANAQPIWDVLASEIWPIFAPNIRHLCFDDGYQLDNLRRLISPTFLTDLDQLNSIESIHLLPDGIADDGPNATAGQALVKWLHTPTKDGQPKEFCSYLAVNNWFDNHKQTFLRATTSVAYNIRIFYKTTTPIEPFELVNERTNEKLTLTKERDRGDELLYAWLLKRCPINVGETAAVAAQKDENLDHLNGVHFNLYADYYCIGPMSPPADQSDEKAFSTPGPSDQQKNEWSFWEITDH